jgi:hypothetical protein
MCAQADRSERETRGQGAWREESVNPTAYASKFDKRPWSLVETEFALDSSEPELRWLG